MCGPRQLLPSCIFIVVHDRLPPSPLASQQANGLKKSSKIISAAKIPNVDKKKPRGESRGGVVFDLAFFSLSLMGSLLVDDNRRMAHAFCIHADIGPGLDAKRLLGLNGENGHWQKRLRENSDPNIVP
jgi:hypothetical protein